MSVVAALMAEAQAEQVALTVGGAIIMTLSIALVLGLNVFCMARILRETKPGEHLHAPLDIDTHDLDR